MVEDWVPHELAADEQPKASTGRTIAIWVALIFFFCAIYALFTSDEPDAPPVPGYSGWWLLVAAVAGFVIAFLLIALLYVRTRRYNALLAEAEANMVMRNFARAAEQYAAIARGSRRKPMLYAIARFNQAVALNQTGDSEAAAGLFIAVERMAAAGPALRRAAAVALAGTFALGGDTAKARRWFDAAKARPVAGDLGVAEAATYSAEAVLLCREGRFEDALAHYERVWPRLEYSTPTFRLYDHWLLRAYATAQTSTPRTSAAAEPYLRMLRGRPASDFMYLTAHWPALATFVTTELTAASEHAA